MGAAIASAREGGLAVIVALGQSGGFWQNMGEADRNFFCCVRGLVA